MKLFINGVQIVCSQSLHICLDGLEIETPHLLLRDTHRGCESLLGCSISGFEGLFSSK